MGAENRVVHLSVEGMTCGGCAEAVKRVIRKLDPEASVEVSLDDGKVDAMTVALAADLAAAITKAGYTATPTA